MKKLLLLGIFLALSLSLACPKTSQPTKAPTLEPPTPELPNLEPPNLDLYSLTQRLRLKSPQPIPRVVNPFPPSYQVGDQQDFSLLNMETYQRFSITATLRYITPHAYWYVVEGIPIAERDIESSAREFEEHIYADVTQCFGTEWTPGVDNDPHLTILNAKIPGVAGYFSSPDEYSKVVNPYSNEREMIYINIDAVRPGSTAYNSVLAHEFQHAIHWRADPTEEAWVNEGLSNLAADMSGYPLPGVIEAFTSSPDTQLTAWADDPAQVGAHYGAAYLFMKYLVQRYGSCESLMELLREPADSERGIDAYLRKMGYDASFDSVFKDWVIANYVDDIEGGIYGYKGAEVHAKATETFTAPGHRSGTVHQYATKYYDLRLAVPDATVTFTGTTQVKLVPNEPHSGAYQWWSNRGDSIDSTLTREFDLTGLQKATLAYWLWYDIEKGWDYAYVEVSVDGGQTWDILPGQHTTEDNPVGNSFGPAYTGTSGGAEPPLWVREEVDLSSYAGRKVMVRFEYVTDDEVDNNGLCIDDISIAELGYFDDAESDGAWLDQGFRRIDNTLEQRFVVQIIEYHQGKATVRNMPLDASQKGRLTINSLGKDTEHAALVISAITPLTTELAYYQFAIDGLPP